MLKFKFFYFKPVIQDKRVLGFGLLVIFFVSMVLFYGFEQPGNVRAAWFDDNWAYREGIPITTHSASESNVFETFQLDTATLITNGKLQSSCQDIRITDTAGKLLKYHIGRTNACNASNTTIDFLIPTMPAGAQIYYVYYGNPTAISYDAGAFSQSQCGNSCTTNPTLNSEENTPGPVAFWKFNEGYGTTTSDSSASSNATATLAGPTKPTWQTDDLCIQGKCLFFDGSSSNLTVANVIKGIKSVSIWIRPNTVSSSALIDLDGGTHKITISSGTISATGFTSPTIYVNGIVTSTVVANRWQQVEVTTGTSFNSTSSLTIGKSSSTFFQGFMDQVKIYPYVRTAAQVLTDFNSRGAVTGAGFNVGTNKNNVTGTLSDGLVAYYRMDESSWTQDCSTTSVTDSSGNGNNGKSCPNTTGPTTTTSGQYGSAGSFDGSNDYVDAANGSSLQVTGALTLSAWVNLTTNNTVHDIIAKDGSSGSFGYRLFTDASGKLNMEISSDGTATTSQAGATTVTTSAFHHLVGVYIPGKSITVFVDGVQDGQNTTSIPSSINNPSTNLNIGGENSGGSNLMTGVIDEARVYNRALGSFEVQTLYNFAAGPIGFWNFEEGSGTTANDISTNANNGTFNSNATYADGNLGKAASFAGGTDSVSVSNTISNIKTVEFWVYASSNTANYMDINTTGPAYLSASAGTFSATGFTSPTIYLNGHNQATAPLNAPANSWFHIAVTTNTGLSGSAIKFGRANGTSLTGRMDEVRVYNYVRTAKQIIEDMNAGHPTGGPAVPAVWWKFNEGYGTTAHASAYSSNTVGPCIPGVCDGTMNASSQWTNSGKFGKALTFNGTSDYVDMANLPAILRISKNLTISAWIKLTTNNATHDIFSKDGSSGNYAYRLYTDTSGKLNLEVSSNGTAVTTVTGNTTLSTGTWYHVAGVYVPSTSMTLYINGVQDKQSTSSIPSSIFDTGASPEIGSESSHSTNFFSGTIDEVKVYQDDLTPDQILIDMNQNSDAVLGATSNNSSFEKQAGAEEYCIPGDTTTCTAPVIEYKFEEKSGTTAQDTSGNNNTGTLNGSVSFVNGKFGGALKDNNTSGSMVTSSSSPFNPNSTSLTAEVWFNVTDLTFAHGLISQTGASCDYWIAAVGGQRIQTGFGGPAANNSVGTYTLKTWAFGAVTSNTTTATLYVNGLKDKSFTLTPRTCTGTLRVGELATNGTPFFGSLDNVRIYNYIRTPAQIKWDMDHGNPTLWFKMDDCQGTTVNDSSGNGFSGTLSVGSSGTTTVGTCTTASSAWGGASGNSTTNSGKINYALTFDGIDDNVQTAAISPIATSTFTTTNASWGGWFNPASSAASKTLIEKSKEFQLTTDSNSFPICGIYYSGAFHNSATPPTALTIGSWNHVVCTYDGTNINTYLNGRLIEQSSETNSITTDGTTKLYLGQTSGGANFYQGQMDDIRVYNYPLTSTQVQILYNNGAANFTPSTGAP